MSVRSTYSRKFECFGKNKAVDAELYFFYVPQRNHLKLVPYLVRRVSQGTIIRVSRGTCAGTFPSWLRLPRWGVNRVDRPETAGEK